MGGSSASLRKPLLERPRGDHGWCCVKSASCYGCRPRNAEPHAVQGVRSDLNGACVVAPSSSTSSSPCARPAQRATLQFVTPGALWSAESTSEDAVSSPALDVKPAHDRRVAPSPKPQSGPVASRSGPDNAVGTLLWARADNQAPQDSRSPDSSPAGQFYEKTLSRILVAAPPPSALAMDLQRKEYPALLVRRHLGAALPPVHLLTCSRTYSRPRKPSTCSMSA